jgi:hypothetical protein
MLLWDWGIFYGQGRALFCRRDDDRAYGVRRRRDLAGVALTRHLRRGVGTNHGPGLEHRSFPESSSLWITLGWLLPARLFIPEKIYRLGAAERRPLLIIGTRSGEWSPQSARSQTSES